MDKDGNIRELKKALQAREVEIEALKKANSVLLRKQSRHSEAEKLAGFGYWERDLETSSLNWSEGISHIFGVSTKDIPKSFDRFLDFVHPFDRFFLSQAVETCLFTRKKMDVEYRIFRKDGRQRTVHTIARFLYGNDGKPVKLAGSIQDITAANEAEARFSAVFQYSINAIFLVDEKGRFVDVNPAATRMTGYEKEELVTMKVWDVCPLDQRSKIKKKWNDFVSQKEMLGDLVIETKNKETVFTNYHAVSHIFFGIHLFVLMDVTPWKTAENALRESEMLYRHIVESLNEGIWELDDKGVIRFVTPRMAHMLGLDVEEMIGRHFFDFIPKHKMPEARHYLAKGQSGIQEQHDFKFVRKDGNFFHSLMEGVPLFNEQGEYTGTIASVLDISERRQEEKRKDLALNMLGILNRSQYGSELVNQILARVKAYADFDMVNILLDEHIVSPGLPSLFGIKEEIVSKIQDIKLIELINNNLIKKVESMAGLGSSKQKISWFPFYTPNGSLWTNSTTALLSEAMIPQNTARIVRIVNRQGFESMAIVPLCSDRRVIGALLIRDLKKDRFRLDDIRFFEGIGDSVGLAIEREQTMRALKKSELEWSNTFNAIHDWVAVVDKDHRIIKSNYGGKFFFGLSDKGLVGKTCCEVLYGCNSTGSACPLDKMLKTKKRESIERRLRDDTWVQITVDPLVDDKDNINGAVHIVRDISFQKKSEKALNNSMELLRAMAVRVSEAEEAERKHLARELHDRVGQNLAALSLNLSIVSNGLTKGKGPELKERLSDSLRLLEETTDSIRDVMNELRPEFLDDFGMLATLNRYAELFSKRTKIRVSVSGDDLHPRPPRIYETSLLRIAQECLNNVAKHANAGLVKIQLEDRAKTIRLEIRDDGKGFDVNKINHFSPSDKWGLISMQERACALGGEVRVHSEPGAGTRIITQLKR